VTEIYELVCVLMLLTKESHACGWQVLPAVGGWSGYTKVYGWHNHIRHFPSWLWLANSYTQTQLPLPGSGLIKAPDGWVGAWADGWHKMSATSVGHLSQHQENANQFVKFSHMMHTLLEPGRRVDTQNQCSMDGPLYPTSKMECRSCKKMA